MRFPQFIAITWLALLCALAPAHAEKRVALVIGNDRYANLPAHEQLQKAVNDARAVGQTLGQLGFEVISGENVGRQALVDKLDAFSRRLGKDDTAFFFFSGHGVALGGANYILPSDIPDVEADQEVRLARAALAEHDIVADLQGRGVRVAVVVLDACRTNPFRRGGDKGVGGNRGLAPPPQVRGVFSLYAASAGQSARDRLSDDDPSPNSVFSRVLLPALTRPGLDLTALAVDVRQEVARIAQGAGYDQQPAYYDGLTGRLYLAGLPAADADGRGGVSPPPAGPAGDEVAWSYVGDTKDAGPLRRFIAQFPASPHRREAEERLKALEPTNVAVVLPVRPAETAKPAGGPCSGVVAVSLAAGCTPLTAAQERALKPKDTFRECENCPEMVVVPAGSFTMGSPEGDRGQIDGHPQHVVTITTPFAVGKFHVTVDQFATFVQDTGYQASSTCYRWVTHGEGSWRNPGFTQDGSYPVVCVSWDDAKTYVDWMAKKTGKPYRLLSEAEFEYAARGRTSPGAYPRFWFGNDEKDLCRYANGADQKARDSIAATETKIWFIAPCDDGYAYTSPAGHYQPNAFGLYDMAGNAWQLIADCWHDSYNGAPADGSAWITGTCPRSSNGNVIRVMRGGSWHFSPWSLRAGSRDKSAIPHNTTGFRLARMLTL